MKKGIRYFIVIFVLIFAVFTVLDFKTCKKAVFEGIFICANIIIPSLFPFSVCAIFIMNSGVLFGRKVLDNIGALFSLDGEELLIMFFSLICGYPVGAKMLKEHYDNKKISLEKASLMLCFCINAGPAFIISAVGSAKFNSKIIGTILLLSHIFSTIIIAFFLSKKLKISAKTKANRKSISLINNFTNATAAASQSVTQICFYVILFSIITSFFEKIPQKFALIKKLALFLEISVGVEKTNNIFLISFLLGFSGVCVWLQIFSIVKEMRPKISTFILFRILHGAFSATITVIIFKLFNITVPVFSKSETIIKTFYNGKTLGFSLIILAIFFILSITSKKSSGNIIKDLI